MLLQDRAAVQKALDHARALALHEQGTGKRKVSRYGRLHDPRAADPARGSFHVTPRQKRR